MGILGKEVLYMHPSIGASIYFFVLLSCAFVVKSVAWTSQVDLLRTFDPMCPRNIQRIRTFRQEVIKTLLI